MNWKKKRFFWFLELETTEPRLICIASKNSTLRTFKYCQSRSLVVTYFVEFFCWEIVFRSSKQESQFHFFREQTQDKIFASLINYYFWKFGKIRNSLTLPYIDKWIPYLTLQRNILLRRTNMKTVLVAAILIHVRRHLNYSMKDFVNLVAINARALQYVVNFLFDFLKLLLHRNQIQYNILRGNGYYFLRTQIFEHDFF